MKRYALFLNHPIMLDIKIYLGLILPFALLSLFVLLGLLKQLVNNQVEEKVERFTKDAKIPKALRNRIGVKIK